ncbi:small integral membrane protein 45 isoform X2 [Macaca mulatta]
MQDQEAASFPPLGPQLPSQAHLGVERQEELEFGDGAKAAAMPHFLDWFVPVYLVISVLILVGFGACIYYFEPGLQEAHKWRMQRPLVDRDLRKTLMVRDNLAFRGPEV